MRFGDEDGHYELNPFPGNGLIVVSNNAFIQPTKRGLGLGSAQHQQRLATAKRLGYTYMLCTVRIDNTPERRILYKNGWKLLQQLDLSPDGSELWGKAL